LSILDGELADELTDALDAAGIPYAATVTRMLPGDGPSHNPGPSTPDPHACQGWVDEYDQDHRDGTLIQANDRKVIIVASSLDIVPTTAETVTIRGATYSIIRVALDPAGAVYEMQARA
jgi:hypothetical protein